MPTLSLVIIAKDERDRIANAISSVPLADEVVVLDSGSSDGTPELARSLGARVVETGWPGFVAQKNRALEEARGDWVLSLDADEWLTDAARASLADLLSGDPEQDGYRFARCSEWMGRPIRHGRWYPDRRVRLVRRGRARWVGREPADTLWTPGPVGDLEGDIGHRPYRSFREHLATIDRYTAASARSLVDDGIRARPWDPWVHGGWHVVDHTVLRQGFRDGWRGWALGGLGGVHAGLKWWRVRRWS